MATRRMGLIFIVLAAGGALVVGGVGLLFFGPASARFPDAFRAEQDTTSQWTCQQVNRVNSSSFTASADGARFSCSRIVLINRSDAPWMRAVADQLAHALTEAPKVRHVEQARIDELPPRLDTPPDLFIILDVPDWRAGPAEGGHELTAEIDFTIGRQLWSSREHVSTSKSAPLVGFSVNGMLLHESTNRGHGPDGSQFDLPAKGMAEQLAESIAGDLAKLAGEYPPMPDVPDGLYGRLPEADPIGVALEGIGARHVTAYGGLFRRIESYWLISGNAGREETLRRIHERLAAEGFTGQVPKLEHRSLRMKRGEAEIEAFPVARPPLVSIRRLARGDSPEQSGPQTWCIRHVEWFTDDQVHAAIDDLLEKGEGLETLLLFQPLLDEKQTEALLARCRPDDDLAPDVCVRLAGLLHDRQRDAEAADYIRRAAVLSLALPRSERDDLLKRAKELAGKLGDESLADPPTDRDELLAAGYVELTPKSESVDRPIRPGRVLRYLYTDKGGNLHALALHVRRPKTANHKSPFVLYYVDDSLAGMSSGPSRSGAQSSVDNKDPAIWHSDVFIQGERSYRFVLKPDPDSDGLLLRCY